MAIFTSNPTFGLPSQTLPVADTKSGLIASIWYQFFTRLSQLSAESPIQAISLDASPSVYTAYTIGHVIVQGGTVSSTVLTRSGVSITCPANSFIPVAANDTVTVTYSAAPNMQFIPDARA